MDVKINKDIYNGLVNYNKELEDNFGNSIVDLPPVNKKYPYTIFSTIRDVANKNYNSCYGKISNKGYKLDIYAQDKGKIKRNDIAQQLSEQLDTFMNFVGLSRVSYNEFNSEQQGTVCHIIVTYDNNYDEYRRKFF